MMKFNTKEAKIEYCDGNEWMTMSLSITTTQRGSSPLMPASSCKQIALNYKSSSKNGHYWIKPSASDPPFKV